MSEWRETTLADLCTNISYGYTESAKKEKIGPKFLRITDIASGRLDWTNVPYCTITDSNYKKYKLSAGDIIIARTGATTGANYTVKESDPEDVVYASYLIKYQIDRKRANPYFIGNVLKSLNWKEYVDAIAGGSAQPGANAKQLGSFEITLPPLPEQTAIAAILSSLDDKIDLLHRQNDTLEKMAEALFRQWFVVEAKEEWEEKALSDFVDVKYGKDHKSLADGTIPVYGSGGLMRYAKKAIYEQESVLVPRKGTLNNIMYQNEPFWTVDTMFYTEMKLPNIAKFVYYFLKDQDLASMNVGSAVPSMTTEVLNNLPVLSPPKEVFEKFESAVSPLFQKSKSNQSQIRILTQLRDTLLPKLMSGEVRVQS
jgi:type I restriction enzyme S subunit